MTEREQEIGVCDSCHDSFHYYLVHNGFNDSLYLYCDLCGTTAILSLWSPQFPRLQNRFTHGIAPPEIEDLLRTCSCGGRFRTAAEPRCPKCHQVLSPKHATCWIEENAPGAKKGWRWQQSWKGLYCIVIERQLVFDNFLSGPWHHHTRPQNPLNYPHALHNTERIGPGFILISSVRYAPAGAVA